MKHLRDYRLFEAKQIYYHASSGENTASIRKDGLSPDLGKKVWVDNEYPKGIYMFDSRDDALLYAVIRLEDGEVWEVDAEGIGLKEDPESMRGSYFEDANSYYTTDAIPPDRLRMLDIDDDEKDELYRKYENDLL